ncbi:MAG: hypothetical protein WDO68_15500 [Gammaproteobacteria bacterium]
MKLNSKSRWGAPLALLATSALVTGCGGGGSGSGAAPVPQNTAPVLSPLVAQTVNQDTPTPALAFTVSDDGGAGAVTLTTSSSDATLLPGLVLGGSGGTRTLTVTPGEDATGTANVTVTAMDAQGKSSAISFPVTVTAVSQSIASYTNTAFALMEGDTPVPVRGFTFVQDADDDATFAPLLQ